MLLKFCGAAKEVTGSNYLLEVAGSRILVDCGMHQGDREEAKPILKALSKDVNDAIGAESAYILIEDTYNSGDYATLEDMVYEFADKNSNQVYWLAKSFIALGDSFADRGETEQATATWQSIADNYSSNGKQDDVLEQVQMRLKKIQSKNSAK